jgi:hypothetical protein
MPRWLARALPLLSLLTVAAAPSRAVFGPPPPPSPYDMCDAAVAEARTRAIPDKLLPAIARVESGRLDPAAGRVRPWPWTINVDGIGSFFDSKDEAVAAVQALRDKGVRSIDVGCMQVNLYFHPAAFPTLDAAFDPPVNAAYAASFLTALYGQTKDWSLATAMYHSQTQERGEEYQRLVFGRVMTPMGPRQNRGYQAWPPPGAAFGAIPPPSYAFGAFAAPQTAFNAPPPAKPARSGSR